VRLDPATLVTGLLVLFVVLSALVGAIAVLRTSRRPVGPARKPFIVSWLANAPAPIALGAGFAIDPARDRRGVSALGAVIGLALAISGVVAVALVDSSIDELLSSPRAYAADWDLEMSDRPDDVESMIRQTLAEPLVEALAIEWLAGGVAYATHHGDEASSEDATAFENLQGSIGPMLDVGRPATGPDEVMLGHATADDLDVEVGGEITFTARSGVAEPYVVTGIGWMADDEDSDSFALMTTDGLARLQEEPETNGAYVRLASADPDAIERLHDMGWADAQAPAKSANLGQIGDVPAMLALALCVLGLAGVLNALLVALRRRRDDLAITRAIGFTTSQTASTMRWQGITTATLAILLGVPVGVIIGRSIWRLLVDGAGVTDLVTIPWAAIIVVPVAAVVVVTAIAALVGRRAAHLPRRRYPVAWQLVAHRTPVRPVRCRVPSHQWRAVRLARAGQRAAGRANARAGGGRGGYPRRSSAGADSLRHQRNGRVCRSG
jgi:ABC-type lipoprotein release transport system permease subunit